MGQDPDREPPFFFSKPADAVFAVGEGISEFGVAAGTVPYPPQTENLHYEIELVVAIGQDGADITPAAALDYVWGYGVGVDLTRRDLQDQAKLMRRPWDLSKGFDASGPCSPLKPVQVTGHPGEGRIWLSVDGEPRQLGDLADQIWSVPDVIAHLSRSVTLRAGDLIFTGTPAGVGAIVPGNRVTCGIDGLAELDFVVT
jgi:fumarylpyruvate hydrolase